MGLVQSKMVTIVAGAVFLITSLGFPVQAQVSTELVSTANPVILAIINVENVYY